MSTIKFTADEFEKFVLKYERFSKELDSFMRKFLLEKALEVLAETKLKTPVDTGDLRNRWELTNVVKKGDIYEIQIFNTLYYASYIEDGHKQQVGRFVPGEFINGRFQYKKGAHSGIILKKPFVNGFHMCRISLENLDAYFKEEFEYALNLFLKRYEI